MQITDHIQQLLWVDVYADSDKYRNPADARGPENVETVEILLAGEVLYPAQDGTLQCFGRGTIFWHQSCEYFICRNAVEDSRYRCAVFTFASTAKKRPVPSIGVWQDLTQLDLFVHEAVQLFLAGNTNLDMLSVWIYGTLLRQYIATPENACQHIPQVLAMALRHINYVMPQNLSIAELANKAGCSVMHLNRLFKQQFQLTPAEYILKQRMLFAANLLNSSLSVQRIASECGFKTTVGFYKAFNKVYNTTPGKYRMMQANKLQHKFNNVK